MLLPRYYPRQAWPPPVRCGLGCWVVVLAFHATVWSYKLGVLAIAGAAGGATLYVTDRLNNRWWNSLKLVRFGRAFYAVSKAIIIYIIDFIFQNNFYISSIVSTGFGH